MAVTISPIDNGESGASVRAKLNTLLEGAAAGTLGLISPEDLNALVDTEAPAVPTGLTLEFVLLPEPKIVATWNFNDETDFLNYDIQWREYNQFDVPGPWVVSHQPSVEQDELTGVKTVTKYGARVSAIDKSGNRSGFSTIVTIVTAKDTIPPATPIGLEISAGIGSVWFTWTPNTESDLYNYEIYESESPATPAAAVVTNLTSAGATFIRVSLDPEKTLNYWVRAVDTSGNRSPWSARKEVTTPPNQAITTEDLVGLVDATSLAASIAIPGQGATLPATPFTSLTPKTFWRTTDKTLWRQKDDGSGWVQDGDTTLLVGKIEAGQIGAAAVGTNELKAGAATIEKLAVMGTNAVNPDPYLTDASIWKNPTSTLPSGSNIVIVNDVPYAGASCFRIGSSVDATVYFDQHKVPIDPTKTYLLETVARRAGGATTNTIYGVWRFWDATGNQILNADLITAGWTDSSYDNGYMPANATLAGYPAWSRFVRQVGPAEPFKWPTGTAFVSFGALTNFGTTAASAQDIGMIRVTEMTRGELVVNGSIKGQHLVTDSAVITGTAQIADLIVTSAKIVSIKANQIEAGTVLSGSVIVNNRSIGSLATSQVLFDDMSSAENWQSLFGTTGVWSPESTANTTATAGKVVVIYSGAECWMQSPELIAFDPSKLYKITFRVLRAIGGSASSYLLLGLIGYAADKTTIVDSSGTAGGGHYVCAYAASNTVPSTFTEYVGYVKGNSTPGSYLSPSPVASPARLHSNVRYFRAMIGANYGAADTSFWLDSVKIEQVNEDAAAIVNAGTTKILPGQILISGATTLASWTKGGDNTKIDGSMVSAGTILANSASFGLRGIGGIDTLTFEHNSPGINQASWTAGNLTYTDDSGATVTKAINSSGVTWTGTTLYIYYQQGQNDLYATTNVAYANAANSVILAVYKGGTNLVTNYGRTIIDGSNIKTGTIQAAQADIASFRANILTANVIKSSMLDAEVVTAINAYIGGQGRTISFDPTFAKTDAWAATSVSIIQTVNTDAIGGRYIYANGPNSVYYDSYKWPVSYEKDYELEVKVYQDSATNLFYGVWRFWDAYGNPITNVESVGFVHNGPNYYFPSTVVPAGSYFTYKLSVGPNGVGKIPPLAKFCSLGFLPNYNGIAGDQCYIPRLQMSEMVNGSLVVKGSITADRANIADFRANILTANSITAGMLQAGSITADKITASKLDAAQILQNGSLITDLFSYNTIIGNNSGSVPTTNVNYSGWTNFLSLSCPNPNPSFVLIQYIMSTSVFSNNPPSSGASVNIRLVRDVGGSITVLASLTSTAFPGVSTDSDYVNAFMIDEGGAVGSVYRLQVWGGNSDSRSNASGTVKLIWWKR